MTAPVWFAGPLYDAVRDFRAVLPAEWLAMHGVRATAGTWGDMGRRLMAARTPETWVLSPPAYGLPGAMLHVLDHRPIRLVVNMSPPPWGLPPWHPVWAAVPKDYGFPVHRALIAKAARVVVHDASVLPMLDADAVVIPDAIPALPAVPDRPPGGGLEMVWVGSATHTADVAMVVDPVRTFLTEEPGARITFLGAGVPRGLNPGPRVTGRPAWDSLATCMGRLQDMAPDVVVLPLVDHPANAMRGGTAALLAAACGAAVIASARGPYARDLRHGHTARLVADSPDAWLAALRTMAHMPALRDALAVGLRAWVRTTRTMDHTGPLWAAAVTP